MTEPQVDTREQIAVAIKNHLIAKELIDPAEEMVYDWAIVVHFEKIESDGHANYIKIFANPNTPAHVGIGMFSIAINQVKDSGR